MVQRRSGRRPAQWQDVSHCLLDLTAPASALPSICLHIVDRPVSPFCPPVLREDIIIYYSALQLLYWSECTTYCTATACLNVKTVCICLYLKLLFFCIYFLLTAHSTQTSKNYSVDFRKCRYFDISCHLLIIYRIFGN